MAKRKLTENQSLFKKQIRRIKQAIRRQEKKGYKVNYNLPTEVPKRVTKKLLNTLKNITPKVLREKYSEYVNKSTGEVLTGVQGEQIEKHQKRQKRIEKRERKEREKRLKEIDERINRQIEGEKYDSSQGYLPFGGDIIVDNIVDDLISVLSEPSPGENIYGGRKRKDIYETTESCRLTLYNLLMNKIAECGKSEIGWRLEQHADELESLKTAILYGSDGIVINSATRELAEIINGDTLSFSELADLHDEAEQYESYEY